MDRDHKPFSVRAGRAFDSVLSIIAPRRALQNEMCRELRAMAIGSYRGASTDRQMGDWLPGGGSADADLLWDLPRLRERSRDLVRNDGAAAGVIRTMVDSVIGTGHRPQSLLSWEELGIAEAAADTLQTDAERIWSRWVQQADASGHGDFYDLQALAYRQYLENGDTIVLPVMLPTGPGRDFSLAFQVVEADRLATPTDKLGDNDLIREGVEIGYYGQPLAYWIRKSHPGDVTYSGRWKAGTSQDFVRIQARNRFGRPNAIHLFRQLRAHQSRGVPILAPTLVVFRHLNQYLEAELMAARIAACYALLIRSDNPVAWGTNTASSTDADGKRLEKLRPGMIEYLRPGETTESFAPNRPNSGMDTFVKGLMRQIAVATGNTYSQVSGDFSQSSYIVERIAQLGARRGYAADRRWFDATFSQLAWEMMLEEAWLRGQWAAGSDFYGQRQAWTRCTWLPPGQPWADPENEGKAAELALRNNLTTYSREIQQLTGMTGEEMFLQLNRDRTLARKLDLPLPDDLPNPGGATSATKTATARSASESPKSAKSADSSLEVQR